MSNGIYDGLIFIIIATSCLLWLLLGWQWFSLYSLNKGLLPSYPAAMHKKALYQRSLYFSHLITCLSQQHLFSHALCQVLPLLGLLGTVQGMINVFSDLSFSKGENPIHYGISLALLSTFAGLAAAIPSMFVLNMLNQKRQHILLRFQQAYQIGQRFKKERE